MHVLVRLAQVGASAVLGVAIAVAVVALHSLWWGMLLGLVTVVALLVALPAGWSRLPFAVGYAAVMLALTAVNPGGDVIVAANARGWIVILSGMVALGLSVAGLRPPRRESRQPTP